MSLPFFLQPPVFPRVTAADPWSFFTNFRGEEVTLSRLDLTENGGKVKILDVNGSWIEIENGWKVCIHTERGLVFVQPEQQ